MNASNYLLGIFQDEEQMKKAAGALREHNISIEDIYTPFPVHHLDEYLDIKRSRLPIVTFIAGGLGLLFSLYFQYWTSVHDWPINVGGKPMNSFIAFIPVSFEIMVLFGALITVAAFFWKGGLFPGKVNPILDKKVTVLESRVALAP